MRSRQSGLTFLGLLVLILVVGTWVYAGIRLTPIYLEYFKVASTMEKVRDEYQSNPETSEFMIRKAFERHFNIEAVNIITEHDLLIKRDGGSFLVTADYQEETPFAFNIFLVVKFDKSVEIRAR